MTDFRQSPTLKNVAATSDPLRSHTEWVKFDDESNNQKSISTASKTITVENTDIPKNNEADTSTPAIIDVPSTQVSQHLSTIDLPVSRNEQEGYGKCNYLTASSYK